MANLSDLVTSYPCVVLVDGDTISPPRLARLGLEPEICVLTCLRHDDVRYVPPGCVVVSVPEGGTYAQVVALALQVDGLLHTQQKFWILSAHPEAAYLPPSLHHYARVRC